MRVGGGGDIRVRPVLALIPLKKYCVGVLHGTSNGPSYLIIYGVELQYRYKYMLVESYTDTSIIKEILYRDIARYLKWSGLSHYIWGRVTLQVQVHVSRVLYKYVYHV
jgi:hypothetical protein